MQKTCSKCGCEKDGSAFHKRSRAKDGLQAWCKECVAASNKDWYASNQSRRSEASKRWRDENREKDRASSAEWYELNKGRKREYERQNKDRINAWRRNRRKSDPAASLAQRTRVSCGHAIRGKSYGVFRHLPYTPQELTDHLKSTLPDGYTEADICDGSKLHIDHIRPVSSFNLTGETDDEFLACWALDNLQLLPARENQAKSNKLDWCSKQ